MLNLKNTSKLFLAAFVFSALVSFSRVSNAAEIDCSGKTGYQLTVCEQQKALAEKNAKSNQKAEDKAKKTKTKAADKANKTVAKAANKAKEATESVGARAGGTGQAVTAAKQKQQDLKDATAGALAQKKEASARLTEALRNGDTAAAEKARADMVAANKAVGEYAVQAKQAEKDTKEAKKAQEKVQKASEKAEKAEKKAAEKAKKAEVKAAKKQEKTAEKDLKKANKELEKIQKKCDKDPENCDTAALQAAMAKVDAAKELEKQAQKNREDVDGTTAKKEEEAAAAEAARLKQLNDSMEEDGPFEPEIKCTGEGAAQTCVEVTCDANGQNCTEAPVGTYEKQLAAEKLDKNGNPVSAQRCAEAKDKNIFHFIACKAMTTLADIRVIVYTLAGFGLIAFAFAAIFNKISWKHLAHLCIALFILSMMTPFIEYFTHDDGTKLTYGNYLPAGFTNINGSDAEQKPCDVKKGEVCPDVTVDTSAKNSKWSWKDLKNTVKSGINAAKTAYNTYKTVKSTVDTAITQARKIGTAIKNSEGGLTGVLDTVGEVAIASNTLFNSAKLGAAAVVANTSSIANDIQTAGKSKAELQFDKENQTRIAELEKKMAAGNLSPQQMEYAKAELDQRKAAVDKNKVADFANTKGAAAVGKLNKVVKTAGTASKIATTASNAAQQGATIGGGIGTTKGDTLGAIFGLATAAGETIGSVEDNKQAKIDAANAQKAAAEKKAAEAKRKAEIQANNKALSQGKQWDNSYNATMDKKTQAAPKAVGDTGTGLATVPQATAPKTDSSSSEDTVPEFLKRPEENKPTLPTTEWGSGNSVNFNSTGSRVYQEGNQNFTIGGVKQGTETFKDSSGNDIKNAYKNDAGQIVQTNPNGSFIIYDSKGNIISGRDENGKDWTN